MAVALGALAGCANDGALGQSQVSPSGEGESAPGGFEAPVAVGGSQLVDVHVTLQGSTSPPLTLLSGNESIFTVEGQTLVGTGPGVASLLITTQEAIVLDFIHVWIQSATDLALQRRADDGALMGPMPSKIQLLADDEIHVSVSALSLTQPLLGAPSATWSADPEIVTLLDEGIPGRIRVVARKEGKTEVGCKAFGLETSFTVEVMP